MTTSFDCIATLSEQELLDHFTGLVVRDCRVTADLLVAIAEIDERKLWAKHACSSMFTFCMERFHMSEQVTAKRLWAARTARRFPVILGMVERGELHLGAIHLLAKHLTEDNHVRVLERAKYKSSRDVERLIAELAPRADVVSRIRALPGARGGDGTGAMLDGAAPASSGAAPTQGDHAARNGHQRLVADNGAAHCAGNWEDPPSSANGRPAQTANRAAKPIVPLSPRRFKIEITVDEATHDKLRSLQDLLGRSETGRDPAAIISRAIDVLLVRTLARKAACTDRPRSTKPAQASAMQGGQRKSSVPPAAASSQRERRRNVLPVVDAASRRAADVSHPGDRNRTAPPALSSQAERQTRTIPAAVRREVWRRDCGRCCYVDARGHRCRETSDVEFHHKTPFALGGSPTPENIELRCAAHNQYQADLDFGRSFMDRRRERNVNCAAFPGECQGAAAVS